MNKDIIQGNWDELKGKVKQQWAKITDDDILQMKGSYEELHGKIQQRHGHHKDDAAKEIHAFLEKHKLISKD